MKRTEKTWEARTVKRQQNWYLRGWEYRPTENGQKLVYVREYYHLTAPKPLRLRQKLLMAALYLLQCVVYIGFETVPAQGGFVWYAGAPCLLAVIPLFYLGLGVWNYVRCEEYFTFRRQHAAFFRLRIGSLACLCLFGIGALGQTVFLLRYGTMLNQKPEWFLLLGALFCALCSLAIRWLWKKTAWEEVGRRVPPTEKN